MPWFSRSSKPASGGAAVPTKPAHEYYPELSGQLRLREDHELLMLAFVATWDREKHDHHVLNCGTARLGQKYPTSDTSRWTADREIEKHAFDERHITERSAKIGNELLARSLDGPLPSSKLRAIRRGLTLDCLPFAALAAQHVLWYDDVAQRSLVGYQRRRLEEAWSTFTTRLGPERLPSLDSLYNRMAHDPNFLALTAARQKERKLIGDSTHGQGAAARLWYDSPETLDVKRTRAMLERNDHQILPRPTIDFKELKQQWEDSRRYIERAAQAGELPPSDFPYTPYLEVLQNRITSEWTWISEPELFESCVALIEKLKDDVGNALLGYEVLKIAYMLGQDSWRAEQVAAAEAAYLKADSP